MLPKTFTKDDQSSLPSQYTMSCLKKYGERVKVRCLTDFIEGKSVWGEKDGKDYPYRFKIGQTVPVGCIGTNRFTREPNKVKGFVAAVVYNYANKQVEILESTNFNIKDGIFDLEHDEDWGDTKNYDITLARSGSGTDTRYSVVPSNKNPFVVSVSWEHVKLDALFSGENPFSVEKKTLKEGAVSDTTENDVRDISEEIPF